MEIGLEKGSLEKKGERYSAAGADDLVVALIKSDQLF
jgi:hypothetical protein